jgi:hypothetical protein
MALAISIVALAVIGTLVAAAHLAAIQAHRAGERRFRQAEALAAAEYGVERVAANAPLAAWRAMLPGATDSAGSWTVGGARVAVRITRLGDSLQPVVLLEGIGSAGSVGARRALRTTSLTMSISEGRFAPLGALTIGGPVSIGAGVTIEGADLPPAGWSCPPGGAALPGIATPDASTVSAGACGPGCLGGAPPVAQLAPAADSTTYLSFGELSWAQLAATARPISPVAFPAPVISGGACLTSDPGNWGDPSRSTPPGACESFAPVLYAPGDLHLTGGTGQGVLLVGGNLTVSGGARFAGLVVARGTVHAHGTGGRIEGAVMAASIGGAAGDIAAPLAIVHSRCALRAAEAAATRLLPVPFRGWVEVH